MIRAFGGALAFGIFAATAIVGVVSLEQSNRLLDPASSVAAALVGGAVVRLIDDLRRWADSRNDDDAALRRELDEIRRLIYIGLYTKAFGFEANAAEIVGTLANVLLRHPELTKDMEPAQVMDWIRSAVTAGIDSPEHSHVKWALSVADEAAKRVS